MEANSTLAWVFEFVIKSSWQAAVLVGLVLLAQRLLGGKLAPRWRYALWLLVLARLLIPVAPESAFSIYNLASDRPAYAGVELGFFGDHPGPTMDDLSAAPPAKTHRSTNPLVAPSVFSPEAASRRVSVKERLISLWLAGIAVLGGYFGWAMSRFGRRVGRHPSVSGAPVNALLEEAKRAVGVRTPVRLVETAETPVPAMFGLVRPRLLMPRGFAEIFSAEELRLVFLHELTHLKRRDHIVNWFMFGATLVHWFNPMIWLAFARMRADRELACDEQVLSVSPAHQNKDYGQMLIKLLEGLPRPARLPGLIGIVENTNQLKRRITMIAKFKRPARWSALLALPVVALGLITLTDAQTQKERPDKETIAQIEKLGGKVKYDESRPDRQVIGVSFYSDDYWKEPTSNVTDETLKGVGTLTELQELDLTYAQITDAGLEELRNLTKLRKVSLLGTKISGAGLHKLKTARNLTELNLEATEVTDATLANLSEFPKLEVVSLSETKITDAVFAHLKALHNLKHLQLRATQITDAGLESLKAFANLQELDLSALKKVTDNGLEHLQSLVNLEKLNLWRTAGIGDASLPILARLPKLQSLNLFATSVTDQGLANVEGFPELKTLKLERTKVTDAGLVHLRKFPNLEKLYLGEPRQANDAAIQHIKALPKLKVLGLTNGDITDVGLIALEELQPLEITSYLPGVPLVLRGPSITDASLARLKNLAKLSTSLALRDTQISGSGLGHLKFVRGLEGLHLIRSQITDADLVHLKELPDLTVLHLDNTQISDAGLEYLEHLNKLEDLSLTGTKVTDAGLVHLRNLTKLSFLYLSNTKITDDGLAHVAGLRKLYMLFLQGTQTTDSGLARLKPLLNLRYLEMINTKVTAAGIESLKQELPKLEVTH